MRVAVEQRFGAKPSITPLIWNAGVMGNRGPLGTSALPLSSEAVAAILYHGQSRRSDDERRAVETVEEFRGAAAGAAHVDDV